MYIKINGVWEFAFIDSVGSGGGGGSVEYVLQGWGTKVDSVGRNYTVKADSAALNKDSSRLPQDADAEQMQNYTH